MTTQHTPGPWRAVPTTRAGNGLAWRDIVSDGTAFAPSYVAEALDCDAALIAAAPDLMAGNPTACLSRCCCKRRYTSSVCVIGAVRVYINVLIPSCKKEFGGTIPIRFLSSFPEICVICAICG